MTLKSIPSIKNAIPTTTKDSWIHHWESRTKTISCIIMVFTLVFLKTPLLLILSFAILTAIVLSMGVSIKQIVIRVVCFLPFLLLMSLPIMIGGGIPPTQERKTLALLLIFKSLNALFIMFIMFFSQPVPALLNGLAHMKLPSSFISIIFLSWRYVFILSERLSQFYKSLKSRLFQPRFHKNSFKVYGEIMGGMLVKSIDTSEKVYRAMASRGFNGKMPTSKPKSITIIDILKSVLFISSVILLHIIEKWWF
ncbi:cobalt ECF transporter T component CbiQ [Clostridium sp. MSJ-11]|uniref:Cobalt ECF transporter T component CbiQ n=1 Tax=Clostridium mobile TaxID=2841512 RepID=A0ABS6EKJ8_9CLOT|nr:cobalt ECF transporter T component CbiQ [Clostridium mobile]MBU5485736.1 cobalt ECF transporter T component CbiQ [Clostridium mobile]